MTLAYTMPPGPGETDLLLFRVARSLQIKGFTPAGTVQVNTERADSGPCDMDVKVLPNGPVIRISQSLGRDAKGCRLDPAALERAVGLAEAQLATEADCLIVNKFGKHEAAGRGFRSVIADALSLDIPVLVGLNQLNAKAFMQFSDGLATELPAKADSIEDWMTAAISASPKAA